MSARFLLSEVKLGYFEVGKIVNTQGVRGDVRVVPMTDNIERFELLDSILVETAKGLKSFDIERVWYHKQFVILKFKGIDDMTAAETLKTSVLKIDEKDAIPLSEGEYFLRDLYGMKVFSDQGEEVGEIIEVILSKANDVYVVEDEKSKSGRLLIPATKEFVLSVDVAENKMTVHIMEGLRDLK